MTNKIKYLKRAARLFIFFLYLSQLINAQNYQYTRAIEGFREATAFTILPDDSFLILSSINNSLIKIDAKGNQLKEICGFGWSDYSFDMPVDIDYNILKVFVTDKNNHRIQVFNRNLDLIKNITGHGEEETLFSFPVQCKSSPAGNIFILESENNQILKFDRDGQFLQNITDFAKAEYALENPVGIAVDANEKIFVLDDNKIIVFDQYGTGLKIIPVENNFSGINISENFLFLNTDKNIFRMSLKSFVLEKVDLFIPVDYKKIVQLKYKPPNLFILTPEQLLVFENIEVKTN